MAKQKQCTYCKKMVPRLWYSSPPTCPDNSCIAKRNASKSKKGINTPEKKKVAKIKPISDKRAKEYSIYRPLRDQYMKEHPICERCKSTESQDLHHKAGKIGALLYNVDYFCALCRSCHNVIEVNPKMAKEEGFSLDRLNK